MLPWPRTPSQWTGTLLVLNLIAAGLYDLAVRVAFGPEATISVVVRDICRAEPIIPCCIGIVIGHILWQVM